MIALLAIPSRAYAQQAGKPYRIGVLRTTVDISVFREPFLQGLRDHGLIEGRNVVIDWRSSEGQMSRLPELAAELVKLRPGVIVAGPSPAIQAVKDATSSIPIVMAPAGDPLGTGFVSNLARPGGNITGIAFLSAELSAKRLELLKELLPGLRRVGLLAHATDPFAKSFIAETSAAAPKLGLETHIERVAQPAQVEAAMTAMRKAAVDAVVAQGLIGVNVEWRLAALATQLRIPTMSEARHAQVGGLIGYGASLAGVYQQAAAYAVRILKGAKPGDLPVEQPTKVELFVNLKAAKVLGVNVPRSLLLRADEVIE